MLKGSAIPAPDMSEAGRDEARRDEHVVYPNVPLREGSGVDGIEWPSRVGGGTHVASQPWGWVVADVP